MKLLKLLISLALVIAVRCSCGSDVAGNGDVVSTGSIFGSLHDKEGEEIDDTVRVALFRITDTEDALSKKQNLQREFIKTTTSTDGTYQFDSLDAGTYSIDAVKDDIVVGKEDDIELAQNDKIEINITIVIIINQTFNIWNTDNSREITINNFMIENGSIEKNDSGGYALTTAESDTIVFKIVIENEDGDTSLVTARIMRNEDGSSTFEIVKEENSEGNEDEVEVTITEGSGPAEGFLGTITIDVKEPGTTGIESTFDSSERPTTSTPSPAPSPTGEGDR